MRLCQGSALVPKGFEMLWVQVKILHHYLQINMALVAVYHLVDDAFVAKWFEQYDFNIANK